MGDAVPKLDDLTEREKMAGEYRVMGVYPRGHLMEFVRPSLRPSVLPAAEVEKLDDGDEVVVAGWPVARQHPRGREGTVFVTIEDETGDVQIILWPRVFARCRRELGSNVVEVTGRRFEVGRDDERHRVGPEGRPIRRCDASRARLALTLRVE